MLNRHALAERVTKRLRDGRRERDLGDEQQHSAPGSPHLRREPEVELGLAAACDAMEERSLELSRRGQLAQRGQRRVLLRRQDELGALSPQPASASRP